MNTLIISGGNIEVDFALEVLKKPFDQIIGVDGGLFFCQEHQIMPTVAVGDFDTLPPDILKWYKTHTDLEIREYNPIKDAADTQIAVELAMESGSTDITVLGATGTRLDHVLGNIQMLYLPLEKGIRCDPQKRTVRHLFFPDSFYDGCVRRHAERSKVSAGAVPFYSPWHRQPWGVQ